jgi:hypothetical protein
MGNIEQSKSNVFAAQPKADTEPANSNGSGGPPTTQAEANRSLAIGELAKASAVLVWLVFLALGGGILLFYYAHIGYLPEVEWSSSIVHLAVAFLIGGVVGLLLALSLLIPGYIWSEFLSFDEGLKKVFYYGPNEICVRTLLTDIGLPFGAVLLATHIALFVFPKFLTNDQLENWVLLWYLAVSAVLLALVTIIMVVHFKCLLEKQATGVWGRTFKQLPTFVGQVFRKQPDSRGETKSKPKTVAKTAVQSEDGSKTEKNKTHPKQSVFKYAIWFGLSVLLSQVSMILIYLLSKRPQGFSLVVTTVVCTFGVLISNHVVAIQYRRNWVHAVVASLVMASLLLFAADRNSSLSSQIMMRYGLGPDSRAVDLFLSKEGVEIFEQLNLQQTACTQPSLGRRICGVQILSRLGNEYYLQLNRDGKCKTFTLPKQIVTSRSEEDTVNKQPPPCIISQRPH